MHEQELHDVEVDVDGEIIAVKTAYEVQMANEREKIDDLRREILTMKKKVISFWKLRTPLFFQ